ncbi:MAG: Ku protein [Acidobacteria bacterium]|nr:Ku protein [Acidobacteriota bacterium]
MARPYWSGQIQISLVSFSVSLYVATESKSEIRFHQVHRGSGERVRHQKVSAIDEAPVEKEDIVKGYEYAKGKYIQIEPSEIAHLRIPSKHTIDVQQFVGVDEIDPEFFEKPYFVAPNGEGQAEAFAVVREALKKTGKVGLGKIAFGGREHVLAIMAPQNDDFPGMMAYTMRYAEELRNPAKFLGDIKEAKVEKDQLELAEELIKRKTAKFNPEKFKDEYEAALRELVEAKLEHKPIPQDEGPAKSRGKVINLMDALRSSLKAGGHATSEDEEDVPAKKPAASHKPKKAAKAGPRLVEKKSSSRTHDTGRRKSA